MERPSPAVQDYLKAIYRLTEVSGRADAITTGQVAEALAVTTPSASNMLKRLATLGYVRAAPRAGVVLSEAGLAAALEVIRHHRLLETYLATQLGMSWDEVHAEAEVLEHHLSGALANRIAEALGHPERDPHGDPIPTPNGTIAEDPTRPLADLPVGACGVVRRVSDRDEELLRYLAGLGLMPDTPIEVVALAPFGGPLSVLIDGARAVEVPPQAARAVHIGAAARGGS